MKLLRTVTQGNNVVSAPVDYLRAKQNSPFNFRELKSWNGRYPFFVNVNIDITEGSRRKYERIKKIKQDTSKVNNDTFSLYLNWMTSVNVINELAQLKGYVNNANENCMTSKQTRLSTDVIIRSNLRLAHNFRENKGGKFINKLSATKMHIAKFQLCAKLQCDFTFC